MTHDNQDEIRFSIRRIEQRLAQVERALGIVTPPIAQPRPVIPIQPPPLPVTAPVNQEPLPAPSQKLAALHRLQTEGLQSPVSRPTLESTIGKNWASWVGAILLVLGVFFFLNYAWD